MNLNIPFDELCEELRAARAKPEMTIPETAAAIAILQQCPPENLGITRGIDCDGRVSEEGAALEKRYQVLLRKILARIEAECGDAGNFASLREALELVSPELCMKLEKGARGGIFVSTAQYRSDLGKIAINREHVTLAPAHFVRHLARFGCVDAACSLHHEFIHAQQSDPRELRRDRIARRIGLVAIGVAWLVILFYIGGLWGILGANALLLADMLRSRRRMRRLCDRRILEEVQAHAGSDRYQDDRKPTSHLAVIFRDGYGFFRSGRDIDRFLAATAAVRRLYALGLSDGEIGKLVKGARWDGKRLGYDLLEERISAAMRERNLDEDDVEDLVLASDIRCKIYIEKAKRIAQEEIHAAAREIGAKPADWPERRMRG